MIHFLGIDIGSVTAKLALIDENGEIAALDTEKITASPQAAVASLITRLSKKINLEEIEGAGVSGSGRAVIPGELNWSVYSSSLSIASGLLHSHPDVKTIIQIGGQTSLVIALEDGLRKPWKVASNPLCAAGTGRFLDQQAYRLGISMEDFARLAQRVDDTMPRIAARCSVFAKTDLIHLQQKGVPLGTMLCGLCDSIARGVTSLTRGALEEPIYFVGGVAANSAIVDSINEMLSSRNGYRLNVTVPENYLYIEALGSALLAKDSGKISKVTLLPVTDTKQRYYQTPRLDKVTQQDLWVAPKIDKPFTGYLGVDIGSTSTKAVILDQSGTTVMAKNYLMTAGKPVDAITEVFRNLHRDIGDKARIAGVGVTGSGRYLVGSFIGADLIRNEITAQTRAAVDIDPEADIIEVGGQDSKLVIKRNGVVVDYQMNKSCAAGTGSFIDELAEQLGISVNNGDFAALAFQAPHTIDLGSRCAAFMGQAVSSAQQEGVSLEVITASLSNSIAGNYLSKVVGTRKLGDSVILTGAVFYNDAIVSAFRQALQGKNLIVPEHKEVSGAIGAALLAKEEMEGQSSIYEASRIAQKNEGLGKGQPSKVPTSSKFKGFQKVIESNYTLNTFVCKICDNNCTISRLEMPGQPPTFYGSRCDLFDSTIKQERQETPFDEREKLLFKEYRESSGSGPSVGVPRALIVYDYAPLIIAFLNALGAKVVLSSKTNNQIIEQAAELSYTDSCFPIKLLHGHAASLTDVDYILYPSAIRLGLKDGDEDQKYSCPLVQASPYIIRQALGLEKRLLVPTIDFSMGDSDVIKNFTEVAAKMGFSRERGRKAALAGIAAQREFEAAEVEVGRKIIERIRENNQLGVVMFARSYMSQDSGANLGIAEKLAQLGVVPIPIDFLPLASVDIKEYSDRPYWFYEGKHIAGAALTASDPRLYGLVLTNFGCGPNSFIIKIVEDIMGGKPLGQLEIDEHAAEAGIVTRLEAFVDTISGFARSGKETPGWNANAYRSAPTSVNSGKSILMPRMAPHAEVLAATMQAFGVKATVLPESTEQSLLYSTKVTSGTECLPYRVTLGDFMMFLHENGHGEVDLKAVEGFMASAFGPCRFGKYAIEQVRIFRELGFDLPIRTTVSNNAYRDLGLGIAFERLAWKGIVAMDYLLRLLWRTRPYEKSAGVADELFIEYTNRIAQRMRQKYDLGDILRDATSEYHALIDLDKPRRPLVGINGEIFLRSNRFSNCDLARECENAGLEVIISPMGEWIKYMTHRNIEDGIRERKLKKVVTGYIRKRLQDHDEHSVAINFNGLIDPREPSTKEILAFSCQYLSPKCGGEAVISIGSGIDWMENPEFAGVISVMPHGCMPGGVVAAMSDKFSEMYAKPWINLTYDGTLESNNLERINNFAEVLRFCSSPRPR
ncbi:MAG TPA: acyl-CoA dehydratase activase [Dehalococcoidia bacterium]|nr:acyl-CoA dehydratase activase [Dehalococcoidia bacterium]